MAKKNSQNANDKKGVPAGAAKDDFTIEISEQKGDGGTEKPLERKLTEHKRRYGTVAGNSYLRQ